LFILLLEPPEIWSPNLLSGLPVLKGLAVLGPHRHTPNRKWCMTLSLMHPTLATLASNSLT